MFYYEFKARSIQSYIFATDRLKEMVGASALVDLLTDRDILAVIDALKLDIDIADFARRAGGVFQVQIKDQHDALRLRDFWSMYVQRKAPGLAFSHALYEGPAYNAAAMQQAQAANRNRMGPQLPMGSPLAERAPRTGQPAVTLKHGGLLDQSCLAKQQTTSAADVIERKLNFKRSGDTKDPIFPLSFVPHDLEDNHETILKASESDQYLAVIHADGNGLGAVVETIQAQITKDPSLFPIRLREFSNAVEQATRGAVQYAITRELSKSIRDAVHHPGEMVIPARILVLGGDDVTLVTKAEHALDFVTCFQEQFKERTGKGFKTLKTEGLPAHLTAAAGIAFIKAKQPFHMACNLAESLCKAAKIGAKRHKENGITPATLAFHRVTTAMIDDWGDIVRRELTISKDRRLTQQPYICHPSPDSVLPDLSALHDLTEILDKIGKGTARELQKALYQGETHTRKAQRRWRENLAKTQPSILEELEQVLERLTGKRYDDRLSLFDEQGGSPIADAIALSAVSKTKGDQS